MTQLSPQSPFALTAIGLALTLAVASPVHTHRDIFGNWTALYHEDQPYNALNSDAITDVNQAFATYLVPNGDPESPRREIQRQLRVLILETPGA